MADSLTRDRLGRLRDAKGRAVCEPLSDRFARHVDRNGPVMRQDLGPCWVWTGGLNHHGYGRIELGGDERGQALAHRVAWLLHYGRWPDPHALHHCDNPPCVKAMADEFGPAHLYEGPQRDNMRDKIDRGRDWQSRRTHCPQGHPYDEANTVYRIRPSGRLRRTCRACWRGTANGAFIGRTSGK